MIFTIKDQQKLNKLVDDMNYAHNEKDGLRLSKVITKKLEQFDYPPPYYYKQVANYQVEINYKKYHSNK